MPRVRRIRGLADEPEPVGQELADLLVQTPEGQPFRLGDAWRERPAVLALVRHFG